MVLVLCAGKADRFKIPTGQLTLGGETYEMPVNHYSVKTKLEEVVAACIPAWESDKLTALFCINTIHRGIEGLLMTLVRAFGCSPTVDPFFIVALFPFLEK